MESTKIEQLLEGYFEGTTTLAEEKELGQYFTGGNVAPHLEAYVGMFTAFAKAKEVSYMKPIAMPAKRNYRWIVSTAAAVLIAFGLFSQMNKTEKYTGTYENPEVAILKTKQALGLVSKILSQSTAQLGVVKEFDNAPSTFFK